MKKIVLMSLVGLHLGSALCMKPQVIQSQAIEAASPFNTPELRLLITEFLCKIHCERDGIERAVRTIKAWALTDKQAYTLFSKPELTAAFIKTCNKISYRYLVTSNNLPLALEFPTLIDSKELDTFKQSLQKGAELVKLLEKCTKTNEWDPFLNELASLEKEPLYPYLAHYYWLTKYIDWHAQKMLLGYALELQAPQEVIEALIKCGSFLFQVDRTIPSPCLMACQNIITATAHYNQKRAQPDANLALLKEEFEPTLEKLTAILDRLIEHGASVSTHFFAPLATPTIELQILTPIFIAAKANNLPLTTYLLEKGARYCRKCIWRPLLKDFFDNKVSFSLLEALISKATPQELPFLLRWTIEFALQVWIPTQEENCLRIVNLLLTKALDKKSLDEATFLSLIQSSSEKSLRSRLREISLLVSLSPSNQKLASLRSKTTTFDEELVKGGGVEAYAYETKAFLEEITAELLCNKELQVPEDLMTRWLELAFHVTSSDCGKQFWKFIALQFPKIPLFTPLVGKICSIKVYQRELYRPILLQALDLIGWLSKEGIKDTTLPSASSLAQELEMDELSLCLKSLVPHG